MENQLTIILPEEVQALAIRVSQEKQIEVNNVLNQIFAGTNDWEKQVDSIEVKDINDKMSIQLADVARKNVKTARLTAEKIFDAKRLEVQTRMQDDKLEDSLWLKAKQIMQLKFKAIEEKAEWKANFVARYEAEQKELRTQLRIEKVSKINPELNRSEFENMSNEMFDIFFSGIEKAYNDKIEAEKKAEAERIAKEKAEAEERERIRKENERLKAEAEAKEKQLTEERAKAETERKAIEEKAKKEREESERKLKAEREASRIAAEKAAAEKTKLETELKAKADAEEKAKKDAEQKLIAERKEKEKAEKAPDIEKLKVWVNSFSLGEIPNISDKLNPVKANIIQKFEAFKKWSIEQIQNN